MYVERLALICKHVDLSLCLYVYRVRSAARSWQICKYRSFQRDMKYVFTHIDTDRYVYLHVSIPPGTPGLSEHYCAPVLPQQPLHRAAMHATEVTCALLHG